MGAGNRGETTLPLRERRCRVGGDTFGKHNLQSSDMGAVESRRNHSPFEGAAPPSRRGHFW